MLSIYFLVKLYKVSIFYRAVVSGMPLTVNMYVLLQRISVARAWHLRHVLQRR